MGRMLRTIVAVVASLVGICAQAASLFGSTATLTAYYPTATTLQSNAPSAIVGPGVEFPEGGLQFFEGETLNVVINVGAASIVFTTMGTGQVNNVEFDGLKLAFAGAPTILGVSLNPSSEAIPAAVDFTSNSVIVNGAGMVYSAGNRIVIDVTLAPVPEPGPAALLAAGIVALFVRLGSRRMRADAFRV